MNTYFKFTYCFEESMNCFPGTVSVKQFIENTIKEEGHLEETNYDLVKELCSIEQENSTKVHVMQFPMLDVTKKSHKRNEGYPWNRLQRTKQTEES